MSKTWKAAVKRIIITKNKKILKKRAGQNHFNKPKESGKTARAKKRMASMPKKMRWVLS